MPAPRHTEPDRRASGNQVAADLYVGPTKPAKMAYIVIQEIAMPTMNVSLTAKLAEFVEGEVESGRYASPSELVRESLSLLAQEREVEAEKLAALKAAVQAGLDDVEAGRFSDRTIREIADDVLSRGRRGRLY